MIRYAVMIALIIVAAWAVSLFLMGCAPMAAGGALASGMENPGPVYYPAPDYSINRPLVIGTPTGNDMVFRENRGLLAPPIGQQREVWCSSVNGMVYCR